MTRAAAIDGLPLSAVLDDVRLVLRLAPDDVLPLAALRACALEWAHVCSDRGTTAPVPVTLDDLESHVWGLLGGSPDQLPGRLVVVRLRPPARGEHAGGGDTIGILDAADVLAAAAGVASSIFDRPGEHVALVRAPSGAGADRVVVLLPGPEGDDVGEEDRRAILRASLAAVPTTRADAWLVDVHRLAGHPGGLLAGLREALGTP